MNIPDSVNYIINTLNKNNFECFVVGGCVRDFLLKIEPKDFDITTNALPDSVKELFNHTIDTGIKHGTITVMLGTENFEVTTYRIDGKYTDNRRPESVLFTNNLKEDLRRRDFTINAMAYSKNDGFIDYFGGINDIENKIIKGVGSPSKRLKEDALRMMRGVRFACQLGFSIDNQTLLAIKENSSLIKNISIERVRDEFIKLINSDFIENIFLLQETNLYKEFLPEISFFFDDLVKNLFILKNLPKDLRLFYMLKDLNAKQTESILKRLKFDNNTIKLAKIIATYLNYNFIEDRAKTRKLMSIIEPSTIKNILTINFVINLANNNLAICKKYDNIYDEIDETIRKGHCYNLKMLEINGADLKTLGILDGKKIGQILNNLLDIVIKSPKDNNKNHLITLVGEYN